MFTETVQDSTTNPSLILAAAGIPKYGRLIDVAVEYGKSKGGSVEEQTNHATDRLVRFFKPIIKLMGDLD